MALQTVRLIQPNGLTTPVVEDGVTTSLKFTSPTSNTSPCNSSSPNAYIDGSGHLAIQVRLNGTTYTSARLKTQGLQMFHSGRIEANIQMPSHAGLWPAFWMLGSQRGVTWPTVGESDVMENWPTTSNISGPGATETARPSIRRLREDRVRANASRFQMVKGLTTHFIPMARSGRPIWSSFMWTTLPSRFSW